MSTINPTVILLKNPNLAIISTINPRLPFLQKKQKTGLFGGTFPTSPVVQPPRSHQAAAIQVAGLGIGPATGGESVGPLRVAR